MVVPHVRRASGLVQTTLSKVTGDRTSGSTCALARRVTPDRVLPFVRTYLAGGILYASSASAGRGAIATDLPSAGSRVSFWFPVQQDRNRRGARDSGVDEKALPVARSGIPRLIAGTVRAGWEGEQDGWRVRVDLRSARRDPRRHQLIVRRAKEQLVSVAPPDRRRAAGCRNPRLPSEVWKRLHVDFAPAAFGGFVRHPSAVGRKAAATLISGRLRFGPRIVAGPRCRVRSLDSGP
jgi:hypothetical protein